MRYSFPFLVLLLSGCNPKEDFSFKNRKLSSSQIHAIYLQPFGQMDEILIENISQKLSDSLNGQINILPAISFPQNAYYTPRKRFIADSIIKYLQNKAGSDKYFIGLTNTDISIFDEGKGNWGIMGLGYQPGNACVVSSFRLNTKNKKIQERFYKVAVHELGHNFGLSHCDNAGCYMMDADGKMKMDEEHFFCKKCRYFLMQKSFFK